MSATVFQRYAPLVGRDWLSRLPDDERKCFSRWGLRSARLKGVCLPKIGGKARAARAQRDARGKFLPHLPNTTVEQLDGVSVKYVYSADELDALATFAVEALDGELGYRLDVHDRGPGWKHVRLYVTDGTREQIECAWIEWGCR